MKKGLLYLVFCMPVLFASQENDVVESLINKFEQVKPGTSKCGALTQQLREQNPRDQENVLNRLLWQKREAIQQAESEKKLIEQQQARPNKLQEDVHANKPQKMVSHPQKPWREREAQKREEAERALVKIQEKRLKKQGRVKKKFDQEESLKRLQDEHQQCVSHGRRLSAGCEQIKSQRKDSQNKNSALHEKLRKLSKSEQ